MVHAGVGEVEDNFEDRGVHEGRHSREDTVFMSLALQEARQVLRAMIYSTLNQ
jgi:hypothetical protein